MWCVVCGIALLLLPLRAACLRVRSANCELQPEWSPRLRALRPQRGSSYTRLLCRIRHGVQFPLPTRSTCVLCSVTCEFSQVGCSSFFRKSSLCDSLPLLLLPFMESDVALASDSGSRRGPPSLPSVQDFTHLTNRMSPNPDRRLLMTPTLHEGVDGCAEGPGRGLLCV